MCWMMVRSSGVRACGAVAGNGNGRWYLRDSCIYIFFCATTFDWWSCPEMPGPPLALQILAHVISMIIAPFLARRKASLDDGPVTTRRAGHQRRCHTEISYTPIVERHTINTSINSRHATYAHLPDI